MMYFFPLTLNIFWEKKKKFLAMADLPRFSRGWESRKKRLGQSGAHLEPTTLLCSCNGVFTSKVIFRLNFPLIRLPQEPDDQLQEIKLTS